MGGLQLPFGPWDVLEGRETVGEEDGWIEEAANDKEDGWKKIKP